MADAQKDDADLMDPDSYENRDEMERMQRDMDKADREDSGNFDSGKDSDRST